MKSLIFNFSFLLIFIFSNIFIIIMFDGSVCILLYCLKGLSYCQCDASLHLYMARTVVQADTKFHQYVSQLFFYESVWCLWLNCFNLHLCFLLLFLSLLKHVATKLVNLPPTAAYLHGSQLFQICGSDTSKISISNNNGVCSYLE